MPHVLSIHAGHEMNSIFAVGAILFGVLSLVICHYRAIVEHRFRRQWSAAFVASAGLLFFSGCLSVAVVPSTTCVSDEDKELNKCLEDVYQTTLQKVTQQWLVNRNKLPATARQQR